MTFRQQQNRPYRKTIHIAAEGRETEVEYFNRFRSIYNIDPLVKVGEGSPLKVLERLKLRVNKFSFIPGDQVWILIDRDEWPEADINQCAQWIAERAASNKNVKFGFALSNPKFEYWLLLHFEDGVGAETPRACITRLRKYLPDYDKHIKGVNWIALAPDAIERAMKKLDPNEPWPKQRGQTTVALLVKELLAPPSW